MSFGERYFRNERVTGRKARGLQMEKLACKCHTFLSLFSGQVKVQIVPTSGDKLMLD